jgi:UDP-N-acetylglucosamine--N-acetylmuramyl-(pentapeptide) pyrophosphoryl-undecaprenol N-acetylglucosamine transferase
LYIGGRRGMERELIAPLGILYKEIHAGKLRRYFSWKNLLDFFKVPIGIAQSFFILRGFKPSAVFCKGGYVCFPVAVAARMLGIPVILHESDVVPGLANKLSASFASRICVSFEESKKYFPAKRTVVTGNPIRKDLITGNVEDGRAFTGFNDRHPVILFVGGSQGAESINELVWNNLDELLSRYQVAHICGGNRVKEPYELQKLLKPENRPHLGRYRAFGFVGREMKDLYALSDLIVSRAGAITLSEIGFFGKPAILIPLGREASRGDQIDNAAVFAKRHDAVVLTEGGFTAEEFFNAADRLMKSGQSHKSGGGKPLMSAGNQRSFSANDKIIKILLNHENRD